MLQDVGFVGVTIEIKEESREYIKHWMPGSNAEEYVVAAEVVAFKPENVSVMFLASATRVGMRVLDLIYAAWLAQAKHHALHTSNDEETEAEPECCTPGPAKKPLPKC
jgi:hypothetical protein